MIYASKEYYFSSVLILFNNKIVLYYDGINNIPIFFAIFAKKEKIMLDIEKILKDRGITKRAFALNVGISPQNINKAFINPTLSTIERMAQVLNIPIGDLFARQEDNDNCSITCPHCGKKISIKVKSDD